MCSAAAWSSLAMWSWAAAYRRRGGGSTGIVAQRMGGRRVKVTSVLTGGAEIDAVEGGVRTTR